MRFKHIVGLVLSIFFLGIIAVVFTYFIAAHNLPKIVTLADYKPRVVSEVYAKDGTKIAEYLREKRTVVAYQEIPNNVIQAFVSAEDSQFFQHGGINFTAILRAAIANIRAGHTVQGGSTITQQVTKSLLLTPEKTITRKLKEAILAFRLEKNLKKEEILFLYLNQIYLGHGAYGVEAASQNYFRKPVKDITLAEAAMLAGLPQAPSKYSPVLNPTRAKERQVYVLTRMEEDGKIDNATYQKAVNEPVQVYYREKYSDLAPHFSETVRQILVEKFGETAVLDEGLRVYTGLDVEKQKAAQESVEKDLRDLAKRQGFRGPKKNLKNAEEVAQFLTRSRDELVAGLTPYRIVYPSEKDYPQIPPLDLVKKEGTPNLPSYLKMNQVVEGVVTKVDSKFGLVTVRVAEALGLIDLDDMSWARKPDPKKYYTEDVVKDPAKVLIPGDVIEVRIKSEKFSSPRLDKKLGLDLKGKKKKNPPADLPDFKTFLALQLEQEPSTEGALLSYDLETQDIIAMVGGRSFEKSEYNRAIQAARQTGSAFKALIYAAALEKGFTAATPILDAPVVFEEEKEGQEAKKWKPGNFSEKFSGDVLFRTALVKSLNVPTVRILEKIGVDWVNIYAKKLGIFRPLNQDLSMALGSSGITLYEMTKVFSVFARKGKLIHPIIIKKVTTAQGQVLVENVSLDEKFQKEIQALNDELTQLLSGTATTTAPTPAPAADGTAAPPFNMATVFNHEDKEQVIPATSAYIITHLMKGVVNEGTAARARALGKPAAGKTGTTNEYFDAFFVGYTPSIITGVWVGNDNESSIGRLETGASAALPIWLDYMLVATDKYAANDFVAPPGIVFANIDVNTGKLASSKSAKVVREAFKEGTEPTQTSEEASPSEAKDFFKDDLSE